MNNKILLGATLFSVGVLALAAKDPIVMKVAGVDVPKSEFEYLYNKNSQQQLDPQPIDDYVEMFKNYKLKVADAKEMGIDTTRAFKREIAQFRNELAAPYLADSAYLNALAEEAYERMKIEIPTSHIMLFKTPNRLQNEAAVKTLDSIRTALLSGENFEILARKHSADKGSSSKGGSMGYITSNRYPYSFETAAYRLKPGEVSEVVESPVGYHLIKVGEPRPFSGEVLAGHILLLTDRNATEADLEKVKQQADSIYDVLIADPTKFETLARQFSQDPGSAQQGGMLPWFGKGRMVPEFEEASFGLAPGEISKPVHSQFGWHIIKKVDSRGLQPYRQLKPSLIKRLQHPQDERAKMIRDRQTSTLAKKLKAEPTKELLRLRREVAANGLDSAFYLKYENTPTGNMSLYRIGKNTVSLTEFLPTLRHLIQTDGIQADNMLGDYLDAFYNRALVNAEIDRLEAEEPDYRNLFNEYRDGSLLYEASVRKVWDRASKDKEGLRKFFEENRSDYAWSEPRAKGILVQAKNDSVAKAVQARYMQLGKDSALNVLRNEFKGLVKIDKVLAPKGTNDMVDNLLFQGVPVQPSVAGFQVYFMLEPKVITAPEEIADVRALVISDYQNELERQWIEEIRAKFPVEVYEKELKKIKPIGNE